MPLLRAVNRTLPCRLVWPCLYIVLDPLITSKQYKVHAVFFMAAMAFSTTIINGTTARYLLKALGLVDMTPQQLEVLEYVLKVCFCCLDGLFKVEACEQSVSTLSRGQAQTLLLGERLARALV